jgi:hypothetical protein
MLADRILRLSVISRIYETLQQDDNQRVAKEYPHGKTTGSGNKLGTFYRAARI